MNNMNNSIEIYSFGYNDRGGKVRWLAEELGLTIQEHKLDLGEHRKPQYTQLNPFAAVPCVKFNDKTLIESTAICSYLAEQFPEARLSVLPGEPNRFEFLKWSSVFSESLEGRLVDYILADKELMPKELQPIYEQGLRFKLKSIQSQLPQSGFILGDRFTIVDIFAGYSLRIAVMTNLIEWQSVSHYLQRLIDRPAAHAAHFFDGLVDYLQQK
ncbi:glutathione S-transferase family protein [Aliikangiella maris]|uniref:Glutathione S-transferase family protein n=2 Tax=Aliikangiella maris TaxID=3162458 RepID=A0ABV3MQB6_9GAMM